MTGAAVTIGDLSKSFDGRVVLDGIDLEVARGTIVSVIGSSGGGKTTLMRCVNLLERPDRAEISVGGEPVFSGTRMVCRDLARLRQRVGMVFQRFNLFPHLTAVENVVLAQVTAADRSEHEALQNAVRLLRRVGLGHRATAYPSRCRAASSSAWRSRGRSPSRPRSCCSTSRRRRWTRSRPARC
jgi:ABC-type polar amino acid transport system ATPase subunit